MQLIITNKIRWGFEVGRLIMCNFIIFFFAPKIFNYKNVLQRLNTENITRNPSACSCKASEFCYNPAGHIITGDLNIVWISKLRDILSKGPKYREPRSFTWKQNSKLILDSVEEYARRWAKKEEALSEWVKSVMSLVNRRVSVLSRTMSRRHESVFDDPDVAAADVVIQMLLLS